MGMGQKDGEAAPAPEPETSTSKAPEGQPLEKSGSKSAGTFEAVMKKLREIEREQTEQELEEEMVKVGVATVPMNGLALSENFKQKVPIKNRKGKTLGALNMEIEVITGDSWLDLEEMCNRNIEDSQATIRIKLHAAVMRQALSLCHCKYHFFFASEFSTDKCASKSHNPVFANVRDVIIKPLTGTFLEYLHSEKFLVEIWCKREDGVQDDDEDDEEELDENDPQHRYAVKSLKVKPVSAIAASDNEVSELIEKIRDLLFGYRKLHYLMEAAKQHSYTSAQAKAIIDSEESGVLRHDFLVILYQRVVDPQNYEEVIDLYRNEGPYVSNEWKQDTLREELGQYPMFEPEDQPEAESSHRVKQFHRRKLRMLDVRSSEPAEDFEIETLVTRLHNAVTDWEAVELWKKFLRVYTVDCEQVAYVVRETHTRGRFAQREMTLLCFPRVTNTEDFEKVVLPALESDRDASSIWDLLERMWEASKCEGGPIEIHN